MRLMRLAVALLTILPLAAQTRADRNKAFPPHKVIGNVYFVGTADLASFLITTPQGHILVNSCYEETVPAIRESVEKLGFKFTDIKIVVGSHAHGDHMAGDAAVKEASAAQVMAMEQDVEALKRITPGGKPHPIDRVLKDGDEVKLGGTVMKAHLTAGHTKGCTTWTTKASEGGKTYNVTIACSVGWNPGYVLVNNPQYPQISDDYVRSFATLRKIPTDVFLGAHGPHYDMAAKYEKIDPTGYQAYIDLKEKQFQGEFNRQKAAAGQ
jgi:metallo-beta-lactamase class B